MSAFAGINFEHIMDRQSAERISAEQANQGRCLHLHFFLSIYTSITTGNLIFNLFLIKNKFTNFY